MTLKEFSKEFNISYYNVRCGVLNREIDVRDYNRSRKEIVLTEKTLAWARPVRTMKMFSDETGIAISVVWKAVYAYKLDWEFIRGLIHIQETEKNKEWVAHIKKYGRSLNNHKPVKITEKCKKEVRELTFLKLSDAANYLNISKSCISNRCRKKGSGFEFL